MVDPSNGKTVSGPRSVRGEDINPRTADVNKLYTEDRHPDAIVKKDGESTIAIGENGSIAAGDPGSVISSAIDYVNQNGGGIIQVKPGTYTISSTVRLQSDVVVRGAGRRATIIKQSAGANLPAIVKGGSHEDNLSKVRLERLGIDGNKDNNTSGDGVKVVTWDSRYADIEVRNCPGNGLFRDGGGRSVDDNFVQHCRFAKNEECNLKIGSGYSAPKTFVRDCVFAAPGDRHIDSSGMAQWVTSCIFFGTGTALKSHDFSRIHFTNNTIEDVNSLNESAVSISATANEVSEVVISDNHFRTRDCEYILSFYNSDNLINGVLISDNIYTINSGETVNQVYRFAGGGPMKKVVISGNNLINDGTVETYANLKTGCLPDGTNNPPIDRHRGMTDHDQDGKISLTFSIPYQKRPVIEFGRRGGGILEIEYLTNSNGEYIGAHISIGQTGGTLDAFIHAK